MKVLVSVTTDLCARQPTAYPSSVFSILVSALISSLKCFRQIKIHFTRFQLEWKTALVVHTPSFPEKQDKTKPQLFLFLSNQSFTINALCSLRAICFITIKDLTCFAKCIKASHMISESIQISLNSVHWQFYFFLSLV